MTVTADTASGKKQLCAICRLGEIENVAGAGYYTTMDSFYGVSVSTAQSIIVQSDDTVGHFAIPTAVASLDWQSPGDLSFQPA